MMYKHEKPSDTKYPRVVYFCRECKLAFHPMCFTAYHNSESLHDDNLKSFMKSIHPPKSKKFHLKDESLEKVSDMPFYFLKKDD